MAEQWGNGSHKWVISPEITHLDDYHYPYSPHCPLPMRSLTADYLDRLRFTHSQLATLRALGEFQGKQQLYRVQLPEVLKGLQKAATIESTESSNRLEGVIISTQRLHALMLKDATPRSRSEQEIAGYRDALNLIHESGKEMPFSEGTIRQLHGLMYRYMPQPGGQWKATNNDIIERQPDGRSRVRFAPVSAHLTPMAMADLIAHYRSALDQHLADPLVLVPLAILDFLCIHPFPDGNGRMARLLTLQLLYHFDYAVGRFISLERLFEESKETYYETLERRPARQHALAQLLLGRPAARLPRIRDTRRDAGTWPWRQGRPCPCRSSKTPAPLRHLGYRGGLSWRQSGHGPTCVAHHEG